MTTADKVYKAMEMFVKENKRPVRQIDLLDRVDISESNLSRVITKLKKQGRIKVREDKKGYVLLG